MLASSVGRAARPTSTYQDQPARSRNSSATISTAQNPAHAQPAVSRRPTNHSGSHGSGSAGAGVASVAGAGLPGGRVSGAGMPVAGTPALPGSRPLEPRTSLMAP